MSDYEISAGSDGRAFAGHFWARGLYGTRGWIDPVRMQASSLMVQGSDVENVGGSRVREKFQKSASKCFTNTY